jgi:phage gpG-like protein
LIELVNNDRLLDNLRIDLDISPDLENLIRHNTEIGPNAMKLGLRAITKEGSKQIKAKIKSLGLVDSGALAKSVRGVTTKNKSFIGTKMFYAPFLEDGTKPHEIKPKKAKGGLFFRQNWHKSAFNPGEHAYKFFESTWNSMESSGQVQSLFSAGVQQAIEAVQNGG